MASIGCKLKKTGIVMTLLTMVVIGTACEDQINNPKGNPSKKKGVEVSLNIGFAEEREGDLLPASPSSKASLPEASFSYKLHHAITTKSVTAKPDNLYNLEIRQYDQNGNYINGKIISGTTPVGTYIDVELEAIDNCQLVIIAWGKDNTTTLGTQNLSDAQKVIIDPSVINAIPENDMNKMPYVLHLSKVKVIKATNSNNGIIQNPEGEDVRLHLKRLASRLTLSWTYNVSNYSLQQILIEGVPLDYRVIPAPDASANNTYPSLLDQFTTIKIPADQIASTGTYSCWVPANVRGSNTASNSPLYRIKSNAPTGSTYASFIARNMSDSKKKLNYRIYLGGSSYSDFNLYSNTNYTYTLKFNHTGLPVNDRRVTIIDPIPASENNGNLVPTANCFMVAPGGAFCFNPYTYYIAGAESENTQLKEWCAQKKIQSVKVLWQTKENGDVGDPTLGVATSDDDHTNIVDLKNGDSFTDARIYCRVAPNTTGGSGVIAAYDADGNILWSWHVWVTNYSPSATTNETILTPENKRILKLEKDGTNYNPIMDRCLGAYEGYVVAPKKMIDMSRANGFHYQKGRKDPFPGSYPSEEVDVQYHFEINTGRPPRHCLNRYKSDGITWIIPSSLMMTSLQYAYQHPESLGSGYNHEWAAFSPVPTWSNDKTIHDPCPAGWRVPSKNELQILVDYNQPNQNSILSNYKANGGALLQYDETSNRTYVRFSGYPVSVSHIANIGYTGYLQTNEMHKIFYVQGNGGEEPTDGIAFINNKDNNDANNIRCIQDR